MQHVIFLLITPPQSSVFFLPTRILKLHLTLHFSVIVMSGRTEEVNMDSEEQYPLLTAQEKERHGNLFENITADENVFQFIGSSNGHITTARSVSANTYTTQCLGDVSDHTLQRISTDRCCNAETSINHQQHAGKFKVHGTGRKLG